MSEEELQAKQMAEQQQQMEMQAQMDAQAQADAQPRPVSVRGNVFQDPNNAAIAQELDQLQ